MLLVLIYWSGGTWYEEEELSDDKLYTLEGDAGQASAGAKTI